MSSGAWGPPPPGVNLAENQNADIVASVVVVMVFGLCSVALRLVSRLSRTGPGMGIDDYVILLAAVSILVKLLVWCVTDNVAKRFWG
jgi:hypothetical protein